ncbi:Lipase [Drechslerella dactyloides]|uniref:Lipase n=1 Tax=Drechslerella dactyloides TaxID=74499 RepID=A0AAD6NP60_DREDA|nr:Lipase [Drechslerella dactyloides]
MPRGRVDVVLAQGKQTHVISQIATPAEGITRTGHIDDMRPVRMLSTRLFRRQLHATRSGWQMYDPRVADVGRIIEDDFMRLQEHYRTPKNPIVLSHGLFGFDTLKLMPWSFVPPIQYWRGINEALRTNGCNVIITAVPPSASIERRAEALLRSIEQHAAGKSVNIVGAFEQLTTEYMRSNFNPQTPDVPGVRYFSYGALTHPGIFSPFHTSHRIISRIDGDNDGLVSVRSASHGVYKGTLLGPSHLDIINWTNRLKWIVRRLFGQHNKFNAIAFYLALSEVDAKAQMAI